MNKLTFEAFTELCRLNLNEKYVPEIFEAITNDDCLFHPPANLVSRDSISRLYKKRLKIAKKESGLGEEYLNDFEKIVSNLEAESSYELTIASLFTEHASHLIFYEPETNVILGILKTQKDSDLQSIENNITENQKYFISFQKYSKGKLMKEW